MTEATAQSAPEPLVPHLRVAGAAAAIDFYREAFGAEAVGREEQAHQVRRRRDGLALRAGHARGRLVRPPALPPGSRARRTA